MFTTVAIAALAAATTTVSATKLYVSSYAGNITTFNLTRTGGAGNATYNLARLEATNGCAPNASWLQIDVKHRNLFCLDEGIIVANGSLTSFKINDDDTGSLKVVNRTAVPPAPVNSVLYEGRRGNQLLAVAHYTHALTTYIVDSKTAAFKLSQTFNFSMAKPGPGSAQVAPHPHQVLVDPKSQYLVIPDLGADLIRIYYINSTTLQISERPSIPVAPGSGPRHGVFHQSKRVNTTRGEYFYYLLTELSSTVTGYKVTYLDNNGGLAMAPATASLYAYGNGNATTNGAIASGNRPAGIHLAKSNKGDQLIVSNRNATFFDNIKNPDPKNKTSIASDSLATFSLTPPTAPELPEQIAFSALTPAGGLYPRHFKLNSKGDLVAVGLQKSGRVAIFTRCTDTGVISKDPVADYEGLGEVTSIVWDEEQKKQRLGP
ncbi:MAG: hypothetical protein Q9166_007349 [cf. Caloplaca sp. 2 TL-2023]